MAGATQEIGAKLRLRDRRQFIRDADAAGDAIDRLERRTRGAGSAAGNAGRAFGGLRNAAMGLVHTAARAGTVMAGAATLAGGAFVRMGFQAAAGYEMAEVALGNMLRSQRQARDLVAEVEEFAIRSPFAFPEVLDATRQLVAMGVEGNKVLGVVKTVGDAAAGLGSGSEGINRMARALGQLIAKGFPSGEEMRQLADAGVRAWQYLADSIGTSIPEAMNRAEKRMLSGHDAVNAILAGIARDFRGQTTAQLDTLSGRWEEMVDLIRRSAREAMVPFANDAKAVMQFIGRLFEDVAEVIRNTIPPALALIKWGYYGGPLNDEIADTNERLYWLGAAFRAITEGTITDRFENLGRAIGRMVSPSGELDDTVTKVKEVLADLGTILTESVIPAMQDLGPFVKALVFPLTALDDILSFLADHSWATRQAIVMLTLAFGAYKAVSLYSGALEKVFTAADNARDAIDLLRHNNARMKAALAKVGTAVLDFGRDLWRAAKYAKANALWNARVAATMLIMKARAVAVAGATAAMAGAQWALNAAMAANPLFLLVAIVGLLIAGLVALYFKSETFRAAIDEVWQSFQRGWDLVVGFAGDVVHAFSQIDDVIIGLWDGLWLGFRAAIVKIITAWNNLSFTLPSIDMGPLGKWGGWTVHTPNLPVPALAEGGTITRSGSVIVGEDGPEILHNVNVGASVVPLRQERLTVDSRALSGGGGTMPARFEVVDGGRVLMELVLAGVRDEGARR